MGVGGTLHRISAIRNRDKQRSVIGLTYRVGKHMPGKTTLLRDVVGLLANTFNKRVVVVDTSNEIGGDGAVPHSCLGKARRMPVHDQSRQHEVLSQDCWRVHTHAASSVDDLLAGRQPSTQLRMHRHGKLVVRFETKAAEYKSPSRVTADAKSSWLRSLGSLCQG
ncbi:TPA: hypothetical protein ACH3X1_001273 [Trebouxia sp. C0004]